jgi:signal transduction histidine kinase
MPETVRRLPRDRAERAIAGTRVALAAFSLFAIWLDPAEPARHTQLTYTLHSIYVAYAVVLAGIMWRRSSLGWAPLLTHVADIAAFSVFQYLTLGPSSPFFAYFVFSLFCGAVRWGWQGALATAPIVVTAYIVMGAWMSRTLGPTDFELNRFVIRVGYLAMVAALLVYLGRHEARMRQDIERLAHWPTGAGEDRRATIQRVLEHAAAIVAATRVTVVWEPDEEPRLSIASWSPTSFDLARHPSGMVDPIVPAPLEKATFTCTERLSDASPVSIGGGPRGEWCGLPVHAALVERVQGESLLSAPFHTNRLAGRVFFTGLRLESDVALLGDIVARQIAASLDQFELQDRQRRLAIGEERVRLARDLHDGVLQSLTGVRFELQSLASDLNREGGDRARDRLLAMERALALEQRELRLFIEDLKPFSVPPASGGGLAARLEELRERVTADWKIPIVIRVHGASVSPSAEIEEATPRMIHEAIANALKHGQPSRVTVDVTMDDADLHVVVADDGRGFPFRGRYDHVQLAALNIGPVSLRERVTSLGGELAVESSGVGSRVEIRLPMAAQVPEP